MPRREFRVGKLAMTEDPLSATPASTPERKQLTPAAQRALAEAEARRKAVEANAKPVAKEFQGPKGPGTDEVWRLGEQGYRVGLLSADVTNCRAAGPARRQMIFQTKKPRRCAAFAFSSLEAINQRATTTGVPTETRWNRSVISAFNMRMQP
jgi:hypothetical protein